MCCAAARGILLAAGLLSALLRPAAAAEPAWAERPDDEVYIFGLWLDRYVLSDGFIVFFDGKEVYAPLGALSELLEFPIVVDPLAGTAEGWFLNDDRTFLLDLDSATLQLSGETLTVDPDKLERHPDDIYVSTRELERWFPVVLGLRFADLAIEVVALEPLPLQQRIEREDRRSHLRRDGGDPNLDLVEPEEVWFEWPFVDASFEVSGRHFPGEPTETRGRMTTTVAGVFAGLDSEATAVTDSDQDYPNLRIRMGRSSIDGGLLGPLDAREFAFGDVTTPDLPLVAENTVGRGVEISTYDLNRLQQTNRVTLRGELPVGWEVEVYRNGELIDFQTDGDVGNGRYEFANLVTLAGLNEFRLVFYGPQGQHREQIERYFVSPELSEAGRSDFRVAFNQRNRDLIEFESNSRNPDDGENRFVFQAEHGINDRLSVSGGLASLSVDGERRNYGNVSLQGSFLGALGQLDAAMEDNGGVALGGRLQTRIDGWSLNAEQSFFQDYHSELTDNGTVTGHLRSRTALRASGHLPNIGLGSQTLSASVMHDISQGGDWHTNFFGRLSAAVSPFNFSLASDTDLYSNRESESDARLLVGTLLGDFRLRGEVGVNIAPEADLDQVVMTADWRVDDDFGLRFGLRHYAGEVPLTIGTLGVNYQFEHFAVGLNVEGDSEGQYNARLGLSLSFGLDPTSNEIAVRPRPFARHGAVSALVFLDRDNDGLFGEGDEPIPNAGFSGPRMPRDRVTDDSGGVFIVGLQPYRETEIGLNESTLPNPFWVSARRPVRVVTRPGNTTTLMFPVIETGEIDGFAYVGSADGGELLPGGGLRVILSDDKGRVVKEARTAFDGYFLLDRVPYGRYRLSLDQAQLDALGYQESLTRSVSIDADEPFALGQDLVAPGAPLVTAAGRNTKAQTE